MRTPDISGPVNFVTVIKRLWTIVNFSNKGQAEENVGCKTAMPLPARARPPAGFFPRGGQIRGSEGTEVPQRCLVAEARRGIGAKPPKLTTSFENNA